MEKLKHIINGCIENRHKDQKALYERYYGYCLKVVFRYVYRYDNAVEVVNDAFVKIFKNFGRFHYANPESMERILMGWMRTIMINTAIDYLRKEELLPEIGAMDEDVWQQEDSTQSSDQALLYKELIQEIKKLPPAYRVVFNMYVIDGFTHQEIADQLGISPGTSKSNLFKARAHLQKFIQNNDQQQAYAQYK